METSTPYSLSETEKKILLLVDDGLYVTQIADKLGVSKAKVSKILKKFVKLGLVEKVSKYPALFKLTDLGRYFLDVSNVLSGSVSTSLVGELHDVVVVAPVVRVDVGRYPMGRSYVLRSGVSVVSFSVSGYGVQLFGDRVVWIDLGRIRYRLPVYLNDVIPEFIRRLLEVAMALINEYGIYIDLKRVRLATHHFWNRLPDLARKFIRSNDVLETDYKAYGLLDLQDWVLRIWADLSPEPGIESNGFNYQHLYYLQPLYVYHLYRYLLSH